MRNKGFSLVEILFAIAIIAVAITIVSLSFSRLNSNIALESAQESVVTVFNEARSLTMLGKNEYQYGVNIQTSQLVLFRGTSYSSGNATNVLVPLNAAVGIRNINISGGGSSVVFNRLTGATTNTGTFQIYLVDATTTAHTITINGTGVVE